jgi:hypothetical protein
MVLQRMRRNTPLHFLSIPAIAVAINSLLLVTTIAERAGCKAHGARRTEAQTQ